MTNRALFLRALDLLAALRLVVLVDDRDVLLPRAAVDGLLPAVARVDRVVAAAAAVGVHARAAVQRVVAAGPVELVVALPAVERVVAVRACRVERLRLDAASVAEQRVVGRQTVDRVVATEPAH